MFLYASLSVIVFVRQVCDTAGECEARHGGTHGPSGRISAAIGAAHGSQAEAGGTPVRSHPEDGRPGGAGVPVC